MPTMIKYWKPLTVLLLLLAVWLHGDHNGAERVDSRWELASSRQAAKAAQNALQAERTAREQERMWVAAYDLAITLEQQETARVRTQKDRIIAGLRAGRLHLTTCPAGLPQVAADTGRADAGAEGGQSGLVGEEITARLATCDEVTNERNLAVSLMRADRL